MRIGILTQYYPPEMGAPQARLSNLAERMVERGHDVVVLTAMPNYPRGHVYPGYGGIYRTEHANGATIIRSYIYAATGLGRRRLANYFSFVLSSLVAGAIKLPRLDYLMTESPPLFLGISGYLLSRLKGARWILNVSDLWLDSAVQLGVLTEGPVLRLARRLELFFYGKAWCVSGQSKEILAGIRHHSSRACMYHLSNGVSVEAFGPKHRSQETRRELAGDAAIFAVYAGLHGLAQGLGQVLEAAEKVCDLEGLAIVLIGDGPEKPALVQGWKAGGPCNVRFVDPVPRERMPEIVASADIALVPLKEQLFGAVPSKLYEAMGSGVPVILVAGGEAADIVLDAGVGIVVPPGDSAALAEALRRLATDPDARRRMGDLGRQAAVTRFDRKAIADRFIDFLEEQEPR